MPPLCISSYRKAAQYHVTVCGNLQGIIRSIQWFGWDHSHKNVSFDRQRQPGYRDEPADAGTSVPRGPTIYFSCNLANATVSLFPGEKFPGVIGAEWFPTGTWASGNDGWSGQSDCRLGHYDRLEYKLRYVDAILPVGGARPLAGA